MPRVYTGADFLDRVFLRPDGPFLNQAPKVTSTRNGALLQATLVGEFRHVSECGVNVLPFEQNCRGYYAAYDLRQSNAPQTEKGDSGGPITYVDSDGIATIFAVNSLTFDSSPLFGKDSSEARFSPTWDNLNGNGAFIRSVFVDFDEDGVDDRFDNCPPSKCGTDPMRCKNQDQADADGDGWGDVCDNCAPSVCQRRNWPAAACANRGQEDADGDGTGDACDSCPASANGNAGRNDAAQFFDSDGDGVGDTCDNCSQHNAFMACTPGAANPQCNGSACVGTSLGECMLAATGTLTGKSCGNNTECGASVQQCSFTTPKGRCAIQVDDGDGDGIGGPCDLCAGTSDKRINVSSNIDAELKPPAVKMFGDLCEPLPQGVSRAIVGRVKIPGNEVLDPLGSTNEYTTFLTSTGLRRGEAPDEAVLDRMSEPVGFRFCSCFRADGSVIGRDACAQGPACMPEPFSYEADARYVGITTSSAPERSLPPAGVGQQEFSALFTSDVRCDDDFNHPLTTRGSSETCRVGAEQRIVRWEHAVDTRAGRVPAQGIKTAGVVMTHVRRTTQTAVSLLRMEVKKPFPRP